MRWQNAWDYKNGGGVSNQNELAELLGAQEEMLSVVPAESEVGRVYDSGDGGRILFCSIQFCDIRHP